MGDVAPAAEPSAPVDSTPVESTPADSTPAETTPAESAPDETPEITPDAFGWDDWDGDHTAFPEPVRPWAAKLGERHARDLELAKAEARRLEQVYADIMEGREDPRVSEYKSKWETEGKTTAQLRTELSAAKAEYEAYVREIHAREEARETAAADAWKAANEWIFKDEKVAQLGAELMDEGFGLDDLPVVLKLSKPLLTKTREIHKGLVAKGAKGAVDYAMKLAYAELGTKPAPSPAAELAAGTGAPVQTRQAPPDGSLSLSEFTARAVERNANRIRRRG